MMVPRIGFADALRRRVTEELGDDRVPDGLEPVGLKRLGRSAPALETSDIAANLGEFELEAIARNTKAKGAFAPPLSCSSNMYMNPPAASFVIHEIIVIISARRV